MGVKLRNFNKLEKSPATGASGSILSTQYDFRDVCACSRFILGAF